MTQDGSSVTVAIERSGATQNHTGRWLIGADGASSSVRRALGIGFEGFTWPDRLLVVSTPFDFHSTIPGLTAVNYVADAERWYFLLQIPGLWRVMFLIKEDISDEQIRTHAFAQSLMATVIPGITNYEISHTTLYKVHQRVAKTFRQGRAFLAGDAAHINNPLGGMGMNGGIHDAINLTDRLAAVWQGRAYDAELDRYDMQRRLVTLETIQTQTIQNKKNLENPEPFAKSLEVIKSDPKRTYDESRGASKSNAIRCGSGSVSRTPGLIAHAPSTRSGRWPAMISACPAPVHTPTSTACSAPIASSTAHWTTF